MKAAKADGRHVWIDPQTDPETIEAAVAALDDGGYVSLHLDWQDLARNRAILLSEETLAATAAALEHRPGLRLNLRGRVWDRPGLSLDWLEQFPHVRDLYVEVYDALDLSPIQHLHDLRKLHVGETKRRTLSLAFLSETPNIEELSIDGTGGRDFEAVATLERMWRFRLRAARTKTLEGLRGHPTLEALEIVLGGPRDLAPVATIPNLRMLQLWGIRMFETDHLAAIGNCPALGLLDLDKLPNIRDLTALAQGPAGTLRPFTA